MSPLSTRSRSVAGKVLLVTGAASGMGRAIASLFAEAGAHVAVTDRDEVGAARVAAEIVDAGGSAVAWELDVAEPAAITGVVGEVIDRVGPIDILVNDAGVNILAPLASDEFEKAWDMTLAVNLTAQVRLVRACLPSLVRDGAGRIVNIASTEGLGATAALSPYTVSKHGVVGLTRSLACELGPLGVTVNCVCPGPIHTAMTAIIPEDAKQKFARRRVPLRRYGDPEEVAHMVLSLSLPAASFVNGAIIPVDGGLTAMNG